METQKEPDPIIGSPATPEEIFYSSYGDDLAKDAMPFVNQTLRQFVTLSSAFIGGVAAFYDKKIVDAKFSLAVIVCMLVCLAASVLGMLPIGGSVQRCAPYEIKRQVESGLAYKTNILRVAAFFFFLAVTALLVGLLAKPA